jgi:hypothetical protein
MFDVRVNTTRSCRNTDLAGYDALTQMIDIRQNALLAGKPIHLQLGPHCDDGTILIVVCIVCIVGMILLAQLMAQYNTAVYAYGSQSNDLLVNRDKRFPTLARISISTTQIGIEH